MFTYDNDFIKELTILLGKDFDRTDWLNEIGKSYTGVINGDNIGIMSQGGFTDAVLASCDPEFTTPEGISTKNWELGNFGIYKKFCFDDLLPELKRNQKIYDLSENEAAQKWLGEYVEKALIESVIAKAFFASKDSSDYTTRGLDGINGFLKQMIDAVSDGRADNEQIVPIATNSKAWGKTGTNAVDTIEELIENAPSYVKGSNDAIIIMTQAMFDCMAYDLKINKGIYIESQWETIFGGLKVSTYNGYKLVVIPMLDSIINQMQSGDLFYQKPLLAIMTTKDNLVYGTSTDESGIANVDIFEDKNTQSTKVVAKYSLGVEVVDDKGFSLAY